MLCLGCWQYAVSIEYFTQLSYFLVVHSFTLCSTGDTFHISDIVMGIGVLAAGGSIPEATSGIINARNGRFVIRRLYFNIL